MDYRWIGGALCGTAVVYLAFAEARKRRAPPAQRGRWYGEDPRRKFNDEA